jgi:hypothetical protein
VPSWIGPWEILILLFLCAVAVIIVLVVVYFTRTSSQHRQHPPHWTAGPGLHPGACCPTCGRPIYDAGQAAANRAQTARFCGQCGGGLGETDRFCPGCGAQKPAG